MMTAEQLTASILQLAMEGKLVEQRPEEGTGEELYQKIQAERDKLVNEGKIKKQKPLPEITDDEKPFDIPESWTWVRLSYLCENINDGVHFAPKYVTSGVPCYSAKDINNDRISTTDINYISEADYQNLMPSKIQVRKGSLLVTKSGSIGRSVVLPRYYKFGLVESVGVVNVIMVSPYYIKALLDYGFVYSLKFYDIYTNGIAVKHFTLTSLGNVIVPLPPLAEQERIISKIETLMPYANMYKLASEKLDRLNAEFPDQVKKSILQLAVEGKLVEQRPEEGTGEELYRKIQEEKAKLIKEGKIKKQKPLAEIDDEDKPFDIPESWIWVRLNEVSTIVTGGTPSKAHPEYYGGPIPFYKPADIQSTPYMNSASETLSAQGGKHARIIPCKSIAVSCIGNIGKSAMLPSDGTTNQQINSICYYCFPEYMYWYTQSQLFISQLVERASMTTLPIVNKSKMETCLFPMPPLEEQKRIVAKINAVIPVIDLIAT